MKQKNRKKRSILIFVLTLILCAPSQSMAAITEKQGLDVAEFAKNFIEQGNNRRDEDGYPLLTYALSGNWNTCVEIRNKGYNEQLYYIKRNSYYYKNGRYMELGNKWCMDCGTFVTYMLKKTLSLELYNGKEPWHVQDIYNDARKGAKSKYFEFVYQSVSVGRIDYSKLRPGDVIARITSDGNHGMLYLGDGMIAHANRDMIKYKAPAIFGFQVSKLNHYYLSGTVVRIMRIKDGIIPEDLQVNSLLTWPDTGEIVDLLGRTSTEELERLNAKPNLLSGDLVNTSGEKKTSGDLVNTSGEKKPSGDLVNTSGEKLLSGDKSGDFVKIADEILLDREILKQEETEEFFGEKLFQRARALQETRIQTIRIKPLMVHVYKNNDELYSIKKQFRR